MNPFEKLSLTLKKSVSTISSNMQEARLVMSGSFLHTCMYLFFNPCFWVRDITLLHVQFSTTFLIKTENETTMIIKHWQAGILLVRVGVMGKK